MWIASLSSLLLRHHTLLLPCLLPLPKFRSKIIFFLPRSNLPPLVTPCSSPVQVHFLTWKHVRIRDFFSCIIVQILNICRTNTYSISISFRLITQQLTWSTDHSISQNKYSLWIFNPAKNPLKYRQYLYGSKISPLIESHSQIFLTRL